jgi:nifR3 family TIM-barrel protein
VGVIEALGAHLAASAAPLVGVETAAARQAAAPVAPALRIGGLVVDPPVVLAPMAGVTNAAFRTLCRSFGAGLYVSEMVSARALVEGNERTWEMVAPARDEPVRSVQLYTVDPAIAARAVRRLVDEVGVDHVDLNFGCPAPKVTRRGGGAALPAHPVLLGAIVRAAVGAAGAVPVTVKLRRGIDEDRPTALVAARVAADAGASAIALHARTAEQLYSGRADWSAIAELKAHVTSVPVLGNGDIWDADDAIAMIRATGCDGVVVGRGCLGRPWLFRDLAAAFAGRPQPPAPGLGEVVAMMWHHAQLLVATQGEFTGIRGFRKHVAWYLTGFPVGGQRRKDLALVSSLAELRTRLDDLDPSLPFPPEARRVARGHTHGPRPVALPDGWLDRTDDPTPPTGADDAVSGG